MVCPDPRLQAFGALIVGTNMLRSTVSSMADKVDAASDHYQQIQLGGHTMVGTLQVTRGLITRMNVTGPGVTMRTALLAQNNATLSNITAFVTGHMSTNFDSTTLDRYVDTWSGYFAYGSIGLTVLLLLPLVVLGGGLFARQATPLKIAGWTFTAFIALALTVGGAEFAVSVQ